jgi:hypothetical protein
LNVVSDGEVGEKVVEELGDGRLAVKVVGPYNPRQQDKGEGSVRGGGGTVLNNNIEEAGGYRVELVLPCAVDGEQAGTEEREKSVVIERTWYGRGDTVVELRGAARDERGGTKEGGTSRILGLVVPDPVMTRTDVGAACAAAEGIGKVGQLKRRKGLDVGMPGPKVRHISRLLLEGRVTGVASEWSGGLGRLARGQGSGSGGLGCGTGR